MSEVPLYSLDSGGGFPHTQSHPASSSSSSSLFLSMLALSDTKVYDS
jgi:hypothetical protein